LLAEPCAGDAAAACAKVLVNGGTMVTYGAMSQQVSCVFKSRAVHVRILA
jgi:NADPH:quinone reductase-like Zn-dependent oxidoreductase